MENRKLRRKKAQSLRHQCTTILTPAPIFEIPNEILALIFWMNTIPGHTPSRCVQRTLIASSHVCQRWRAVTLGYPALWGRVIQFDTDTIPRLQELLHRSKPAPIDVGRDSQIYLDRKQVMDILSESRPRIRTFNVKLSNRTGFFEPMYEQFLQRPAPLLEFMSLSTAGAPVVQGPLFEGNAPCLRRLHLSRCTIKFAPSMPILSKLTEFSAKDIPPVVAPPASMWLMNLRQMPHLCWLTIINSIVPMHETFPLPQLHLPHLTMLTLKGALRDCVALLDHIMAPLLYGMRLVCSAAEPGHHFSRLLDIIGKKLSMWSLNAGSGPQFIMVDYGKLFVGNPRNFDSIDSWDFSEISSSKSGCHTNGIPICTLDLAWMNPGDGIACSRLLLFAFQSIFEVTTSLVLWFDVYAHASLVSERFKQLRVCFRVFQHLHTLHLPNESSHLILILLSPQTPSDITFPSLKTLCFLVPRFYDHKSHFNALTLFVQTRERLRPLANIVISSGGTRIPQITQRQIGALEKHGVRVDVNDALYEKFSY